MTISGGDGAGGRGERPTRCQWCQGLLDRPRGPGRPRLFCRQSCRQQAYMARKLAQAHGLGDDRLIVDRSTFETAQDRIAMLRQALADIDRDAGGNVPLDLEPAYRWLHRHAVELTELQLLPAWQQPVSGP